MKTLTKIGILLVLMAMLVVYLSAMSFQASFSENSLQAIGITPHNSRYFYFGLPNSTAVGFVYYTNGTPINYYLLNQLGFLEVYGNGNRTNATANTSRLLGNGAIEVLYNKSAGLFPSPQNTMATAFYQYNYSPILPAGNYYSLFQNPSSSNVTVYYSLVTKSPSDIQNSILGNAVYGVSGFAMFFCGLGLVVYSVFLDKSKKPQAKEEDKVAKMYAEKTKKNAKRAKRRRRKAGKQGR